MKVSLIITTKIIMLACIHMALSNELEYTDESLSLVVYTDGLNMTEMSYEEVWQYCNKTGGRVVEILTEKHQKMVEKFMAEYLTSPDYKQFYIGLKRIEFNETNFAPVHGSKSSINIEVTSDTLLNFLMIQDGALLAEDASQNHVPLCEYSLENCPELSTKIEDKCYQFLNSSNPWYVARELCLQSGGDLATFDDLKKIALVFDNQTYWIGYSRYLWQWESRPGIFTTYSKWNYETEDSDHGDGFVCASMNLYEEWYAANCDSTYDFEKKSVYVVCMKELVPEPEPQNCTENDSFALIHKRLNTIEKMMENVMKRVEKIVELIVETNQLSIHQKSGINEYQGNVMPSLLNQTADTDGVDTTNQ